MHSVFYHGTIEWRLFNSTLHAGEAKANIILAISPQQLYDADEKYRKAYKARAAPCPKKHAPER